MTVPREPNTTAPDVATLIADWQAAGMDSGDPVAFCAALIRTGNALAAALTEAEERAKRYEKAAGDWRAAFNGILDEVIEAADRANRMAAAKRATAPEADRRG